MGGLVGLGIGRRVSGVLRLRLDGVAQASIQVSVAPPRLSFRMLCLGGVDQPPEFREQFCRCRIPGRELLHRPGFGEQALAPVLGRMHHRNLIAMVGSIGRQGIAQRTGVDVAHQPSDVLALPAQSAAGVADPLRQFHRIDQLLRDRQVAQLGRLQLEQALAKILQGLHFTLELRFAGFIAPRMDIIRPRGILVGKAIDRGIGLRARVRRSLARVQMRTGRLMGLRAGLAARRRRVMA